MKTTRLLSSSFNTVTAPSLFNADNIASPVGVEPSTSTYAVPPNPLASTCIVVLFPEPVTVGTILAVLFKLFDD